MRDSRHPTQRGLSNDAMLRHMERLVLTGDWDSLKPYLRAAERSGLPHRVLQARYTAGVCIGCERKPCGSCGTPSPLWCEVCWQLILDNCPKGMVVSGLAQFLQLMTKNRLRPPLDS
jgi:hypothetical protein